MGPQDWRIILQGVLPEPVKRGGLHTARFKAVARRASTFTEQVRSQCLKVCRTNEIVVTESCVAAPHC